MTRNSQGGIRAGGSGVCETGCKRTLRVLIADDNQDTADSMSMVVRLWKHDTRVAYDGAAVLQITSAYPADVILLDIAMPKLDGCQVAKQLRRHTRFKDTLLIAVTGWTDSEHHLLCDEAGFDHFLIKPVNLSNLENLLLREQEQLASFAGVEERNKEGGA